MPGMRPATGDGVFHLAPCSSSVSHFAERVLPFATACVPGTMITFGRSSSERGISRTLLYVRRLDRRRSAVSGAATPENDGDYGIHPLHRLVENGAEIAASPRCYHAVLPQVNLSPPASPP